MQGLQPNYYCVVPINIITDGKLSDGAKLLYSVVSSLTHMEGYCYATNEYLSKIFDKDERTIQRLLKELKDNSYIFIENSKNRNKSYRKIFIHSTTNLSLQGDKNVVHSTTKMSPIITNNNNIYNNNSQQAKKEPKEKTKKIEKTKINKELLRNKKDIMNILGKNIKNEYLENYSDIFLELFKTICKELPTPRVFNKTRKRALNALLKSFSFNEIIIALEKTRDSDFLNKKTGGSWIADIDWILKPDKFEQILNGKYDNKGSSKGMTANLEDSEIIKAGTKVEDMVF